MYRLISVALFLSISLHILAQSVTVESHIIDKVSGKPVNEGTLWILSPASHLQLKASDININGVSKFRIEANSYIIKIETKGYQTLSQRVDIKADSTNYCVKTFYLEPLKTNYNEGQETTPYNPKREKSVTYNIKGHIWDKPHGQALANTELRLFSIPNKQYIQGGTTSPDGGFRLRAFSGNYLLVVENSIEKQIRVENSDYDTGNIYMNTNRAEIINETRQETTPTEIVYINGVVQNLSRNEAIDNTLVRILGKGNWLIKSFRTTANGIFRIALPPSDYILEISGVGYTTLSKNISVGNNNTEYNLGTIFLSEDKKENKPPQSEKIPISSNTNADHTSEANLKGLILDSISHKPVDYAIANLKRKSDGIVTTAEAIEDGVFSLKTSKGDYTLEIQSFGYHTAKKEIAISETNTDLGVFHLSQNSILLKEAEVIAKAPSIRVKGDTIEYRAEAYLPDENALLQDLIKNIPGITFDIDGNLMANGKRVTKILIDGKEFFGNDIQMALKNLPANMINKLQIFREETELEKIIAFVNDTQDEQVINLELKDEYKQSLFGDFQLGYGNRDRYLNRGMVNYMDEKLQVSLLGNLNNINDDVDEPGTFSEDTGVKVSKDAGANINYQKDDTFKIGGNIRYSDNESILESNTISEYFLSSGNRYYNENSTSKDSNKKTSFDINSSWTPKSPFSAFFRLSGEYNDHNETRRSENRSYVANSDTTSGWEDYKLKGVEKSIKGSLVLGWKFNDKGRALSLSLNGSMKEETGHGTNKSVTTYIAGEEEKDIDQILSKEGDNKGFTTTISYVEPLSKDLSLMLSYSYNKSLMDRNNDVYKLDDIGNYSVIDSAYTRGTKNREANQIISIGLQGKHEKFEYNTVFNIEPTKSTSKIMLRDSLIQNIKQDATNYSTTLRFIYKPQKNTSFNILYTGIINQPGVDQLSTDTVIISPLNKIYGNRNLKHSFTNNLNLQFQKSDFETGRFFMLTGGFNMVGNKIAEHTQIDAVGNTETTYRNVNGNWGANMGLVFSTPLKNSNFAFDSNTSLSYVRNLGFVNEDKSLTNNYSINENMSLNFNSDIFETRLQANYTYIRSRNNLSDNQNRDISSLGISNSFSLQLPWDFNLQNNISYTHNTGYSEGFKKNEILWSASLTKYFLKKKKGALKFQFYDILKDRNNISRVINSNYMSDIKTNAVSQYFLLSFIYRFNISPKPSSSTL